MSGPPRAAAGAGSFPRGVHPAGNKGLAGEAPIEVIDLPEEVRVPLLQHTGAPCQAVVKNRQSVVLGELLGKSDAFVSASVHAPMRGKVAKESVSTLPNGRHVPVLPVRAEGEQLRGQALWDEMLGGEWPRTGLDQYSAEQIVQAVREAGVVGLGGAAFPTHVKLARNPQKPTDTLLLNGSECEPYLTADYRLMLEAPGPIVTGALLGGRAVAARHVIIAIEDNKPAAAESMLRAAEGTGVQVVVVETKYPMGGERQLIPAVLRREVPTGGLPLDIGVVVMNVGTAAAVARAVVRGKPLTHRVLTVSGRGIGKPKNLLVSIGTPYRHLLEVCGGLRPEATRLVAGGPMMGFAVGELDTPVTKGTSGLTALTEEDVRQAEPQSCIRCGRCVDVCPLHLVPTRMAMAAHHRDWELARRYHIVACMECGCCAYNCPSRIPLVQLIRMGKAMLPR